MPSGDAQRSWFPEMIAVLRREWDSSMSFTELIALCDRLDAALQAIRRTRGIVPPMMRCAKCGAYERARPPRLSVRATVLALSRFEIARPRRSRCWRTPGRSIGAICASTSTASLKQLIPPLITLARLRTSHETDSVLSSLLLLLFVK
jgi:hypothetical protein